MAIIIYRVKLLIKVIITQFEILFYPKKNLSSSKS